MIRHEKRRFILKLYLNCSIIFFLFLCFTPGPVSAEDKIYVFYTGAQSPIKEILEMRLDEAFHRIGKKSRLVFPGSAQRALLMANKFGDGDALRVQEIKKIAPDLTDNLLIVPEPIIHIIFYVYTKEKIFQVDNWESLKSYHNGFRVGAKILEKNIPGKTTILPDAVRLFKMLDQNRLDTVTEQNIKPRIILKAES